MHGKIGDVYMGNKQKKRLCQSNEITVLVKGYWMIFSSIKWINILAGHRGKNEVGNKFRSFLLLGQTVVLMLLTHAKHLFQCSKHSNNVVDVIHHPHQYHLASPSPSKYLSLW